MRDWFALVQFPTFQFIFFCSRSLQLRTKIEGLSTEYFTEFFIHMELFRVVVIHEKNNSSQ